MLKNYKELKVWQKSYQLCLEIYKATKEFPDEEKYGLKSQLRRAAVSVPSNISEGYSRKTTPEYIQFLYIAYGSICEIETQTLLSSDFGYVETEKFKMLKEKIKEVERMLKSTYSIVRKKTLDPLTP